ncbi:hypothetical protein [Luteolibacter algae]|uniref:hypothetical protein n=1 Tax=Luteolibacter algae TaxID=454151 RepID=UPI0036DCDC67
MIDSSAVENNHGPANIGQAKYMASSALGALRAILPEVAENIEGDLAVIVDFTVPEPKTQEWLEKQKAPLLIGQLKAIADPFYRHLNAVAPAWLDAERTANGTFQTGTIFPWTSETEDDQNKAFANIGQLKVVFSLRFDEDQEANPDGISDLLESYFISVNPNDQWTDLSQIDQSNIGLLRKMLGSGGGARYR